MATKEETLRKEFEEKFVDHKSFTEKKLALIDEANELRKRIYQIEEDRTKLDRQDWEVSSRLKELYRDAGILHVSITGTKKPGVYTLSFFRYVDGEKKVHLTRVVSESEMPALNGILYGDCERIYEMVEQGLIILSGDKYVVLVNTKKTPWCYEISDALMNAKAKT
ncbi:hypothetical protein HN858_04910 [Candidatus Falkowbacteria bacterium]|mgnify:CR=1 FL=1|jgi:hypothetical protein|nr:hypothetical protein [Candidatus Falkowbacteria bacterium]MBT7348980.1 hypothetical protein [Candidatus Falkowbacteria bacterium]MBT7500293.1 hypothetical protein [Candidatus Falkowbacteria bacterium]